MKREPVKRPRPKQDLKSVTVRLSPGDLARLDRIAEYFGYRVEHGPASGRPDRTEAIRKAVREMDNRLAEKNSEKSKGKED